MRWKHADGAADPQFKSRAEQSRAEQRKSPSMTYGERERRESEGTLCLLHMGLLAADDDESCRAVMAAL